MRGPGGHIRRRRQRVGDLRVSEGEKTETTDELLHCVVGDGRFSRRTSGHTVRHHGVGGPAPKFARVFVYGVPVGGLLYYIDILFGGRLRRQVLGHTASHGLQQERADQNGAR